MITISNSLGLASRGLFFEILHLMERNRNAYIECEDKELAEQLRITYPHFCRSLKILVQKQIFVKTREGIRCPMLEREIIRNEIKKAFSRHG